VVIGAGPAGAVAALRAARLGSRTALITRDRFGGMAANDGPVPVRTLAHAARLVREARQLDRYGVHTEGLTVDYPRLLARVHEVVDDVGRHSILRDELEQAGVAVHEHAGDAGFLDRHTVAAPSGLRLQSRRFVICAGGTARRLPVPGAELTATHSDAWGLTEVPASLLVVGAGATGVQVASIFNALGSQVNLYEAAQQILPGEDSDVALAVAAALRDNGITVLDGHGAIARFEDAPGGVRMAYGVDGAQGVTAQVAVVAIGWRANTTELNLAAAGVETDDRGFVRADPEQRTSAPHIFAAGDITGRAMLVHEAVQEAWVAGTNAALGPKESQREHVNPVGSFTDPEYASVGMTEEAARRSHDVLVAKVGFGSLPRPIIDGRPSGFCKLVVDRPSSRILGCHIVGERAIELVQIAAVAISSGLSVVELARVPFSFPTYANVLGRTAVMAAIELGASGTWMADRPSP
jgi:pyruvate/2-oxoglutarate dehydrogenase complex dihydrolipoamide dehydrogenase (E3) component